MSSEPDHSKDATAQPGRRKQPERVAKSDAAMLSAAMRLIAERGYRGTSLAAIGELSGYSRGLVTARFGSKAGLLSALVKGMLWSWKHSARDRGTTRPSGLDALHALLDNHRRALEADRGMRTFYALLFEAVGPTPDLRPQFSELDQEFRSRIERSLNEGIASGLIRSDVDVQAQATLILSALRGIGFQWLLDPAGFPVAATYDELERSLIRTLSA